MLLRNKCFSSRKNILYLLYRINDSFSVTIQPLEIPKPLIKATKSYASLPFNQKPLLSKTERELLNDLIYILQGGDGKYLKFSKLEEKYSLQNSYISPQLGKLLDEVAELAYLYKKIQKFMDGEHICLASQSLSWCMQNELSEYYRLVSLFQKDKELTLRKVYLWIMQPIERMKWLAILCDASESLRGNEILSAIYSYLAMGNNEIKEMTISILEKVSSSLMDMIEAWITQGEIRDPFHEFFITENPSIGKDDLWTKKYSLILDQIPCFFPKKLVDKILLIGKSINFLKICCKKEWNCYTKEVRPSIYQLEKFDSWITEISNQTNKELFGVLFSVYKLESHCRNIKKIFLLAQGDFHHSLMEQLIEVLKDRAKRIHKHNLRSILENSIRSSNIQYEDQEFINLIDIRLFDPELLDKGWDVFSLEYSVSSPLTVIFTASAMEKYTKIFKFLWHTKRAHFFLNEFQHVRMLISYQKNKHLYKVIQEIMILRQTLRHFINNFMSYLILEIIEVSWIRFYANFFQASDLDQLIATHNNFLEKISEKIMLKDKECYNKLMKLLDLCINSQELQHGLFEIATECSDLNDKINAEKIEENKIFDEFSADIQHISTRFNEEFKEFRKILIESDDSYHKFLAFKLDFNEYYEYQDFLTKEYSPL